MINTSIKSEGNAGMIWFLLMLLFVVLWRQAEKKASRNLRAYIELRQSIVDLAAGKKSVSIQNLTKAIAQSEPEPKQYDSDSEYDYDNALEQEPGNVDDYASKQPEKLYVDSVADSYSQGDLEIEQSQEEFRSQSVLKSTAVLQATNHNAVVEKIDNKPRQLTQQEIENQKERLAIRNLNTMLYMASFLLVAAAAAFVAASMPEMIRLIGLIVVVVSFYSVGLLLYKFIPRFKPAAIAFVGTGLAILPFVGAALMLLGDVSGQVAWFLTSIIGLVAYVYAGAILKSQVVSYLSMAFALSAASSAVSIVNLPTVWYFISLIGVSLIASTISYFKPRVVPFVFKNPIETTGQIVTPITLIGSIFASHSMSIQMYEILFGISAAHYLVVYLQRKSTVYKTIVRLLTHITILIIAWDITSMPSYDMTMFGIGWLLVAMSQLTYSLVSIVRSTNEKRISVEKVWISLLHGTLLFAFIFWTTSDLQQLFVTLNLLLLGGVAFLSAVIMKQAGWGYITLASSLAIPFTFGRGFSEPAWPYMVIVFIYFILAVAAVIALFKVQSRRSDGVINLLVISILAYIVATVISGLLDSNVFTHGVSMLLAGAVLIGFSYVGRIISIEFLGSVFTAYGLATLVAYNVTDSNWKLYVGVVTATIVLTFGALIHHYFEKSFQRRDGLVALSLLSYSILAISSPMLSELVRVASLTLLLAILVSLIGLRWLVGRDEKSLLRTILTAGYIGYLVLGWIGITGLSEGWGALFYIVATGVIWLASRIERIPSVVLIGNASLVLACLLLWRWLKFNPDWESLCVGIVSAGVLYGSYAFYVTFRDIDRQWLMIISSWLALMCGIYFGYSESLGHQVVSILVLIGSVAMLLTHRYVGYHVGSHSGRLTALSALAAIGYVIAAANYLRLDAQLTAWSFAIAAIMAVWLSYRLQNRWYELFAGIEIMLAAWFAVGLANLHDWRLLLSVAIAIVILMAGGLRHNIQNEPERRNVLLIVGILAISLLVATGNLTESGAAQVSIVLLIVSSIILLGARWLIGRRGSDKELRSVLFVGYGLFSVLAWAMSVSVGSIWVAVAAFFAAVVYWIASYVEYKPQLLVASYLFVLFGFSNIWDALNISANWFGLGVALASAIVYYVGYIIFVMKKDKLRETISIVAAAGILILLPTIYGASTQLIQIATLSSVVVASVIVAIHGVLRNIKFLVELAIYVATFALQRIVGILNPDIDLIWYVHWWALVIAVVAVFQKAYKTARFVVAMGLLTITVGLNALASGGWYQIVFLVEHVLLLAVAAILRKQWAVWWGVAATVAAIFYFIKDYTFLWLGLLGLGLIVLAVWRLNKLSKS